MQAYKCTECNQYCDNHKKDHVLPVDISISGQAVKLFLTLKATTGDVQQYHTCPQCFKTLIVDTVRAALEG